MMYSWARIIRVTVGGGRMLYRLVLYLRQTVAPFLREGANIRMAIATVIVFWTPIEILGRMDLLSECHG